jgi:hypothetical protein
MVMRVTNFGSLYPKSSARAIPDDGAQTNDNLASNTQEFRPLSDDTTVVAVSGVTNPLTIFRLQRNADGSLNTDFSTAARWKITASDINYVKGQINADTTDRHYYTFNDGSAPPRWVDATGADRQLGVPAPTAAPAVVVNAADEYTPEDRNADLETARTTVLNIVRGNATANWRGATHPGTGTTGYTDRTTALGFAADDLSQQIRWYRLSGAGGTIADAYAVAADETFSWVFDSGIPSILGASVASVSAWAGAAGTPHIGIPFAAYGMTYDLDTATIRTQLAAVPMPGDANPAHKIFTTAQIDTIITALTDYADPTGPAVKPKLQAVTSAVESLKGLLDGGQRTSLAAATQAFYSRTAVASEVTTAIANWAAKVFDIADGVARSSLPADYTGSGA